MRLWDDGAAGSESRAGAEELRARLGREISYLLAINTQASGAGRVSPAGLSHSLGVCLIEDWHMSRGKGQQPNRESSQAMPRFVDVKLTPEQKADFLRQEYTADGLVRFLQLAADAGYRIGCSWSTETQAYTVSMTCRAAGSPNNGLCMTSFAKDLSTAVALAHYKHTAVCGEDWLGGAGPESADFG